MWALTGLASILSTVGSVLGGIIGLCGRVQTARSPRERRFATGTVWGLLTWAAVCIVTSRLLFGRGVLRISPELADAVGCTVFWLAALGPLFFFSIWRARQQRRIQIDEGTRSGPSWWVWRLDATQPGFKTATYGMMACLYFGACGWLMFKAMAAGDHLWLGVLLAVCVVGWLGSAAAVMRRPEQTASIFNAVWWGLALLDLVVVNGRWAAWFGVSPLRVFPQLAPWTVDYAILFFAATGRLGWWLKRRFIDLQDARPATGWAIAGYFALLLCGFSALALLK